MRDEHEALSEGPLVVHLGVRLSRTSSKPSVASL